MDADGAEEDAWETISLDRAAATAVVGGVLVERTADPDPDREWEEEVEERF